MSGNDSSSRPTVTVFPAVREVAETTEGVEGSKSGVEGNNSRVACINCSNYPYMVVAKFKCSACRKTSYCSKECQKEHWKVHKLKCGSMRNPEDASYNMFEEWYVQRKSALQRIVRSILVGAGRNITTTHFAVIVVDYDDKKKSGSPFQIVSYRACSDNAETEEFGSVADHMKMLRHNNQVPLNENTLYEVGYINCRRLPDYPKHKVIVKGVSSVSYDASYQDPLSLDGLVDLINSGP